MTCLTCIALSACGAIERPPYGGDSERALAAATAAVDVGKVVDLLRAGADPNKMVRVGDDEQSPWYVALQQLRPGRADTIAIVKAMIDAGASTSEAWGTSVRSPQLPRESFWQRFKRGGRMTGTGAESAFRLAMLHPIPDVIRAMTSSKSRRFRPTDGEGALVTAIETREVEIAHILVDAGVDVNCQPGPNTPLVAAIQSRDIALITYLEAHGAREKP